MCLGATVLLIQLDKDTTSFPRYKFPDDSSAEQPDVVMLFKPGHYDLLYPSELGQQLIQLEQKWDLRTTCELPQEAFIFDEF